MSQVYITTETEGNVHLTFELLVLLVYILYAYNLFIHMK